MQHNHQNKPDPAVIKSGSSQPENDVETFTPESATPSKVISSSGAASGGDGGSTNGGGSGLTRRQQSVLAMQQSRGNAAVLRMLAQRTPNRDTSVRRAPGEPGTQEGKAGADDPFAIVPIIPAATSTSVLLSQMQSYIQQVAEYKKKPELVGQTMYYVLTDQLYVFDGGGNALGTFGTIPNATTFPPGIFALDTSNVWTRFGRQGKQESFFDWGFEDKAAADALQMPKWLSPETLAKLNALQAKYSLVMFAVSSAISGGKGGSGGPSAWGPGKFQAAKSLLDSKNTGEKPDDLSLKIDSRGAFAIIKDDGAVQAVDLYENETPEDLLKRIQDASQKLRESRDPSRSTRIAGKDAAKDTGFDKTPGADEIPEGALGTGNGSGAKDDPDRIKVDGSKKVANAPAYTSHMIFYGSDKDKNERAHTAVNGATNRLAMELDYNANLTGGDLLSQTTARMQTIHYSWELIDVTNLKPGSDKAKKAESQQASADNQIGAGSGAANDISRTAANIQEDQDNSSWVEKAAWLGVQGMSDTIRMGGTLISSFVSIVTTGLNERSMGWAKEGDFLVRCIATPDPGDGQGIVRASSVSVMPVRVLNINTRATEQINKPADELKRLEDQLAKMSPDDPKRADVQAKIAQLKDQERTDAATATTKQVESSEQALALLDKLEDNEKQNVPLTKRSKDVNDLDLLLTLRNLSHADYRKQMEAQRDKLKEFSAGIASNSKGMLGSYRPHVVLVSEVDGQTYQMLMSLGEVEGSDEGKRHYRLLDASNPKTMAKFEGKSSQQGVAGHSEAIRNAFIDFRENNGYGRGSIAIHMPEGLEEKIGKIAIEPMMRSAEGVKGRALQKLKDLATVAEVAALVVGGPAGMAIGVVGGVAGGVIAANNLMSRVNNSRFKWLDFETATDIMGIVGAFAGLGGAAAGLAQSSAGAKAVAAGTKLPGWVSSVKKVEGGLHIFGIVQMASSAVIIPVSLLREFDEIENATISPGEKASRRTAAFLGALKSGVITLASAAQMLNGQVDEPKTAKDAEAEAKTASSTKAPIEHEGPARPTDETAASAKKPTDEAPVDTPVPHGAVGATSAPPKPKTGVDVTAANWVRETGQAMGAATTPKQGRIRVIDHDQLAMIRGSEPPDGVVGFRDTEANILYVSRTRLSVAEDLRTSLISRISGRISTRAKAVFGDAIIAGYTDRAVNNVFQDGVAPHNTATPAQQLLALRLETVAGAAAFENAMFNIDGIMDVRNTLKAQYGVARANAIEMAMQKSNTQAALELLDPPNPGLQNAFGEALSAGVADMLTQDMGGTPRDPKRAKLASDLAAKVGADTLRNAYLTGETEPLRVALENAVGKDQAAAIKGALLEGQVEGAQKALGGAKPEPKVDPKTAAVAGAAVEGNPNTDAPNPSPAHASSKEAPVLGGQGQALKTALEAGGSAPTESLAAIKEAGDFRTLRDMIKAGRFGETEAAKTAASNALQTARIQAIDTVLKGIKARLEQASGGKIVIELQDLGTPGFKSDRDVTIRARAAEGADVSPNELVAASVKGVRDAYEELNRQGLSPDASLDSNFYTELQEGQIKPQNAAERSQIVADQSVVSMAEMRMNMNDEQWKAYREKQLKAFGEGADGSKKILQEDARARTEDQLKQAEAMAQRLGAQPREAMLRQRQDALLNALDRTPPPSARELRQMMADLKLLEPDAYGTRAAYEGVVEHQQQLARAGEEYDPNGEPISAKQRRAQIAETLDQRTNQLKDMSGGERLALLTQEASASAAKMFGHAHDNSPSEVRALAKYLSRVAHAFREAGLKMQNAMVDEAGGVVGTKQEADSDVATMRELKAWAQDRNMSGQSDQAIRDAWVAEAQTIGEGMVTRMRVNEQMKHTVERPVNDPTGPSR